MKLRAFAIIAALAVPGLASATPADYPPTNPPTNPPGDTNRPGDTTRTGDTTKTGDTSKTAKLDDAEVKVISHLHHLNQTEITLAKQAQQKGTARVKDYANTLLTDHQSADKDLTAFAKSRKVAMIPAEKPETDADRQAEKDANTAMAHLKSLKGAEFDKEYLNMMVSDHEKELARIDTSISACNDSDLKSMLQSFKPVLQRHADQARDLQKSPQASAKEPPSKLPSQR